MYRKNRAKLSDDIVIQKIDRETEDPQSSTEDKWLEIERIGRAM